MRIPIVDDWVDKQLESKPKEVGYIVDVPIKIKKGERSGKVDVPCTLLSQNFSLLFPSGVKYIYGDEQTEEKSKRVVYKSCPSLGIELPDIADIDLVIPLKMGFAVNPQDVWKYIAVMAMVLGFFVVFFFNLGALGIASGGVSQLGAGVLSGVIATMLLIPLSVARLAWRTRTATEKLSVTKVK